MALPTDRPPRDRSFGDRPVARVGRAQGAPGASASHADIKAERVLRAELLKTRPEYGFLGEESTEI